MYNCALRSFRLRNEPSYGGDSFESANLTNDGAEIVRTGNGNLSEACPVLIRGEGHDSTENNDTGDDASGGQSAGEGGLRPSVHGGSDESPQLFGC